MLAVSRAHLAARSTCTTALQTGGIQCHELTDGPYKIYCCASAVVTSHPLRCEAHCGSRRRRQTERFVADDYSTTLNRLGTISASLRPRPSTANRRVPTPLDLCACWAD
jgi:hypothetical protein